MPRLLNDIRIYNLSEIDKQFLRSDYKYIDQRFALVLRSLKFDIGKDSGDVFILKWAPGKSHGVVEPKDGLSRVFLYGLELQMEMPDSQSLPFEERLGLMVDCQLTWQSDKRLQTRLRSAQLFEKATIEDFDFKGNRNIERSSLLSLANRDWLRAHQNVLIDGATGVGKSYLACALAHKACREGFTAQYLRCSKLFEDLSIARADGSYHRRLAEFARKDLLVLDDFGRTPLTSAERKDLLEIIEDRYDRRSLIITSQLPTDNWHDAIVDPTIADALLDRVIHNSHKISLKGESRRKTKGKQLKLVG